MNWGNSADKKKHTKMLSKPQFDRKPIHLRNQSCVFVTVGSWNLDKINIDCQKHLFLY